jgi:hypothetical protein
MCVAWERVQMKWEAGRAERVPCPGWGRARVVPGRVVANPGSAASHPRGLLLRRPALSRSPELVNVHHKGFNRRLGDAQGADRRERGRTRIIRPIPRRHNARRRRG